MPERTHKKRPPPDSGASEAADQKSAEAKSQEIEDLLDEIDEVLEDNAEEFVRSYVQKGGQ